MTFSIGYLIYKLGNVNKSNNAAELFLKTTEKFLDWSQTEYSHDIGNLVEFRQEHDFTADQPDIPMAKLRSEDPFYHDPVQRGLQQLSENEGKVQDRQGCPFWEHTCQCSTEVKEELKKNQEYPSLKQASDVIGSLGTTRKDVSSTLRKLSTHFGRDKSREEVHVVPLLEYLCCSHGISPGIPTAAPRLSP